MFTFLLFFPVLHVKSNYVSAQVTTVLSLRLSSHWRHMLRTSRQRNNKMKADVKRNAMQCNAIRHYNKGSKCVDQKTSRTPAYPIKPSVSQPELEPLSVRPFSWFSITSVKVPIRQKATIPLCHVEH